jgi:hypothetical protein
MENNKDGVAWLQGRVDKYRSVKNSIGEVVDDLDDIRKLGSRRLIS